MAVCPNCFNEKEFLANHCPHCTQHTTMKNQARTSVNAGIGSVLGFVCVILIVMALFG